MDGRGGVLVDGDGSARGDSGAGEVEVDAGGQRRGVLCGPSSPCAVRLPGNGRGLRALNITHPRTGGDTYNNVGTTVLMPAFVAVQYKIFLIRR